jgi:hypothetical protein
VSDTFVLTLVALLVVPHWPAIGYVTAVLTLLRVSGRHRLRICLRVSGEMLRPAVVTIFPIPLLLPWADSLGRLLLLGVASFGFLVTTPVRLCTRLGEVSDIPDVVSHRDVHGIIVSPLVDNDAAVAWPA